MPWTPMSKPKKVTAAKPLGGLIKVSLIIPEGWLETLKRIPQSEIVSTEHVAVPARTGRNKVVYRVLDDVSKLPPVPETIRLYLLSTGEVSAKTIEEGTGLKRKSVESAIWGMRDMKIIESISVEDV